MPCPHNEITIVQRSHRQSAVAAAAYQSGEKLFCEYDQQVKHELTDVQAGFRKGRGTRDQIANIHWIIEKARGSKKHLFLLY